MTEGQQTPDKDVYEGKSHITLDVKGVRAHFTGRYALYVTLVSIFILSCYSGDLI
jgi:hypothetical protein